MAHQTAKRVLNLLQVTRLPIYHQLLLEEALLRNSTDNWMVINDGAFQPAIVMGISGKADELINVPEAMHARVQVIKRFSGGGTVVVDHDTVFTSLIFQGESLPDVECYPQPIMKWTESFFAHVFNGLTIEGQGFALRENDYVFGRLKFGGNAQAITGKRWMHHTSLLWDYHPKRMELLAHPKKQPEYRQGRTHGSFLVPLSRAFCPPTTDTPSDNHDGDANQKTDNIKWQARQAFLSRLKEAAYNLPGFEVKEKTIGEASHALQGAKMFGTRLIHLNAPPPLQSSS